MTALPINSSITLISSSGDEITVVSSSTGLALLVTGTFGVAGPITGSVNITNASIFVTGSTASVLYDVSGQPIATTNDSGSIRIKVEASPKPGSAFSPNALIPQNISNFRRELAKVSGTLSSSLKVNGSVTPVTYSFLADSLMNTRLSEIRIVLCASTIRFDGSTFAAGSTLASGVLVDALTSYGTSTLAIITSNEDFINFSSRDGYKIEQGGTKDVLISSMDLASAIILRSGTSDAIRIRIQDDLTAAGLQISYFQATIFGSKE